MSGTRWTLLVTGDGDGEPRTVSVSARALRRGAIAAGVVCAALVVVAGFLVLGSDAVQVQQLERRNAVLIEELDGLRERVSSLQGELEGLSDRDAELRILAGLDSIDRDVRQAGVGGPGSPSLEDHPLYGLDEGLGEEAFAASYDLNALERRARLLRESLEEAGDSLRAHRDLLESTPSILPTSGLLSSSFSSARPHPIHNRALPHEGVDISAQQGAPVMAAANGRVTFAGRRSGYGLMVEIDHGYGYSTVYGHASQLLARTGQEVERGNIIAQVGRSGLATSPHLHYEVRVGGRAVNPMNYVITGAIP